MAYVEPEFAPPYRVLVLFAATEGWYRTEPPEREPVLAAFAALLRQAEEAGARLLASVDDDLFASGQPSSLPYSISIVYDVDDLGVVVGLVHGVRSSLGGYLRVEARVGRPLFLLDR